MFLNSQHKNGSRAETHFITTESVRNTNMAGFAEQIQRRLGRQHIHGPAGIHGDPCFRLGGGGDTGHLVLLDDAVLVVGGRGVPGDADGSAVVAPQGDDGHLLRRSAGGWRHNEPIRV